MEIDVSPDETEERLFAFGDFTYVDEDRSCLCPAESVDAVRNRHVVPIFERYDETLTEQTGEEIGAVPEAQAREAWLDALDEYERDVEEWDADPRPLERGRRAARELGWLDE